MFRAFVVVHHAGVLHILGGFQQVRPYDILAFLGPPVFLVFLLHVTFCLFFWAPRLGPSQLRRTMRRVTQKEGQEKLVGAKNETLCADFGVVRVFLFNPKVGFQVLGFRF